MILTDNSRLTFGELVSASGAAFAVFFSFDFAGVAGEKTVGAEGVEGGRFGLKEGAGETEQDGAGLSGGAAAVNVDPDIIFGGVIGLDQWGLRIIAIPLTGEINRYVFSVDFHLSGAGSDPDARDGGFSAPGAPAIFPGTKTSRRGFRSLLSF